MTPGLQEKRGWWDYVPDDHVGVGVGGPGGPGFTSSKYPTKAEQEASDDALAHPVERWRERIVSTIWRRADTPAGASRPVSPVAPPAGTAGGAPRKSSIHSDEPIPHPDRAAFGESATRQMPELTVIDSRTGLATGVESTRSRARSRGKPAKLTQSLAQRNRLSGMVRIPKMMLLRAVMKDEVSALPVQQWTTRSSTCKAALHIDDRVVMPSFNHWTRDWGSAEQGHFQRPHLVRNQLGGSEHPHHALVPPCYRPPRARCRTSRSHRLERCSQD